ncbi:adenosine deaminase/editase [Marasmius fiardii PR-910]|nr:adenosine deaminase/editase [Marasmius fiardii PR-910]
MSFTENYDYAVRTILGIYSQLKYSVPPAQWTVLASFFLYDSDTSSIKPISISTGTKCLPSSLLPSRGEALHDSHAEVLARRAAIRWFQEEIGRMSDGSYSSSWLFRAIDGKYSLLDGVRIGLYVSTVPCGDSSIQFLAAFQDEKMAGLKSSTVRLQIDNKHTTRGRDNYSLYGVLRTKPGRADCPSTSSMSCSDKIAAWSVLGIQGALASQLMQPIYLSAIVIGDVLPELQPVVHQDCERSFSIRLQGINGLPGHYALRVPSVHFTSISFTCSRTEVCKSLDAKGSCNESLCWWADSPNNLEVLINGFKRGVSPKHRHRERARPQLSKISLFNLYLDTRHRLQLLPPSDSDSYLAAKQLSHEYQSAKAVLMGITGPFSGWVKSGTDGEHFDRNGRRMGGS